MLRRDRAFPLVVVTLLETACTRVGCVTMTLQVGAVPKQAPTHFWNFTPAAGVAVSVTTVPC